MVSNQISGRHRGMVVIPSLIWFILGMIANSIELNAWSNSSSDLDAISTPLTDFCYTMVFVSFIFALIAFPIANQAARKGKSWTAFFWLSILVSPLVTWLITATLPVAGNELKSVKACPKCAETVMTAAILCKHCGSSI